MGESKVKSDYTTGAKKRLVISAKPVVQDKVSGEVAGDVDHVVCGEVDGVAFEVVVAARDALWALSLVSTMGDEEFMALRRAEAGAEA